MRQATTIASTAFSVQVKELDMKMLFMKIHVGVNNISPAHQ
jgi:hypothetical protein